jgi:hypothetical protein
MREAQAVEAERSNINMERLQEAGRLHIAAEMNRWLSTKSATGNETAPVLARHRDRLRSEVTCGCDIRD